MDVVLLVTVCGAFPIDNFQHLHVSTQNAETGLWPHLVIHRSLAQVYLQDQLVQEGHKGCLGKQLVSVLLDRCHKCAVNSLCLACAMEAVRY